MTKHPTTAQNPLETLMLLTDMPVMD